MTLNNIVTLYHTENNNFIYLQGMYQNLKVSCFICHSNSCEQLGKETVHYFSNVYYYSYTITYTCSRKYTG